MPDTEHEMDKVIEIKHDDELPQYMEWDYSFVSCAGFHYVYFDLDVEYFIPFD